MSDEQSPGSSLKSNGFVALAAASFVLIVLGALVRANGAGLACPDWPLCFGQLVPEFDMRVGFEWSHRLLAGLVSLGLLGLTLVVLRGHPERRIKLGLSVAWLLLSVQVVLGGLTVLLRLAPWTVTAHLITGTIFFITLVWLAIDLRESGQAHWRTGPALSHAQVGLIGLTAVVMFGQIVLGGMVSSHGAGLACADFPTCDGESWIPTFSGLVGIHVLHRLNAGLLVACFVLIAIQNRRHPSVAPIAHVGLHLVFLQAIVGILNVLLRVPIEMTAVHSALAAALALSTGLLMRQALGLSFGARGIAPAQTGSQRSARAREAA